MNNRTLSSEQRQRFARNGFLVIRDAIPEDILEPVREGVFETLPEDLNDFESLSEGPNERHEWRQVEDGDPFDRLNQHLYGYATELVGGDKLSPKAPFTQIAARYPTGEYPGPWDHPSPVWDAEHHVDAVDDSGEPQPFTVSVGAYIEDVAPRSGGFTVWPGSHWHVAERVSEHGTPALQKIEPVTDAIDAPFEVSGEAGTIFFFHHLLVHSGGVHLGRQPRLAAFTRFLRSGIVDTFEETLDEPFRYWEGLGDENTA